MRVWLDDRRPAPPGWLRAETPEGVIALLRTGAATRVSLDHDLGLEPAGPRADPRGAADAVWDTFVTVTDRAPDGSTTGSETVPVGRQFSAG